MPKQFPGDAAARKLGDRALCIAAQINEEPKIEAAIRSGKPTMVVSGAMHFCGPRGVVAMLRARGYKIEQL